MNNKAVEISIREMLKEAPMSYPKCECCNNTTWPLVDNVCHECLEMDTYDWEFEAHDSVSASLMSAVYQKFGEEEWLSATDKQLDWMNNNLHDRISEAYIEDKFYG